MPSSELRYPFTDEGLRDALMALGTTQAAVTTNLLAMGARGFRGVECGCPLAVYAADALTGATLAYVYLDDDDSEVHVIAHRRKGSELVGMVSATAGGPLPTFVRLFDRGRFPELELSYEA
jgi:hypothetical protein